MVVVRGDGDGVLAYLGVLMVLRRARGRRVVQLAVRLRVTRTILPPADRSLGNGIFNSGAAVGAVLTPLIVSRSRGVTAGGPPSS